MKKFGTLLDACDDIVASADGLTGRVAKKLGYSPTWNGLSTVRELAEPMQASGLLYSKLKEVEKVEPNCLQMHSRSLGQNFATLEVAAAVDGAEGMSQLLAC